MEHLRGRPGFEFRKYPDDEQPVPAGYIRLGLGGPELSREDAGQGLLVLDATWKLAAKMEKRYADVPVRTLPALQTAYPRTSKIYDDPSAGLATIEAVYAAYHILGWDTAGLLDQYHWADEFRALNGFA